MDTLEWGNVSNEGERADSKRLWENSHTFHQYQYRIAASFIRVHDFFCIILSLIESSSSPGSDRSHFQFHVGTPTSRLVIELMS